MRVGDALVALRTARERRRNVRFGVRSPSIPAGPRAGGAQLSALLPALLSPGARVVVESDRRAPAELPLEVVQARRYRDTTITIYVSQDLHHKDKDEH